MARTTYRLSRVTGGPPLGGRIARASNPLTRMVGLLGRRSLAPGEGLWFEPASSIHTAFMRFAIDVIFLDREGVVLRCVPAMRPFRVAAQRGARAAVELPAGTIERSGVSAGDRLTMEAVDSASEGRTAA